MLLLIDNFDSFSYLLADLIRQTGASLQIVRNSITPEELDQIQFDGLILSPGPEKPSLAGNLLAILDKYHDQVPILGVCLGHQAIGEYFGADLVKNKFPTHGKVHRVLKSQSSPFTISLPDSFQVTRYHSLELKNLPECLEKILETESGEIMGIAHHSLPILGIQYHPEAYLTEFGLELVTTWVDNVKEN